MVVDVYFQEEEEVAHPPCDLDNSRVWLFWDERDHNGHPWNWTLVSFCNFRLMTRSP